MAGKIKCTCGSTYFASVRVNQFKDFPSTLHQPLQEFHVDYDMRIYQCVSCNKYKLPPTNFHSMSDEDVAEYKALLDTVEGKPCEPENTKKLKPNHPGQIQFRELPEPGSENPEDAGRFR